MAMISIYLVLVFIILLIFIHHLILLFRFKQIKRNGSSHPEETLKRLKMMANEARTIENHWLLKRLAKAVINTYETHKEATDERHL